MTFPSISGPIEFHYTLPSNTNAIDEYFQQFKSLSREENWNEIIDKGTKALTCARETGRVKDEAKICAQLTSTYFYKGNYPQALIHVERCHELSEHFEDPSLFIRALY